MVTNKYWANEEEYFTDVFRLVDIDPEYEGGLSEMLNYVARNIKYPEAYIENGINASIIVNFILMADGSIKGVSIRNKVNTLLDQEVIRVVRSMPDKWKPAEIEGKKVNVGIQFPVRFTSR